jgi:hypothetical protein
VLRVFTDYPHAGYWALQSSFVFLLMHSLRWNDLEDRSVNAVRILIGLAWVTQSFIWAYFTTGQFWLTCIPGALVLIVYWIVQRQRGNWGHLNIAIAAGLVTLSGPVSAAINNVQTIPAGLLAIIGSFLLFGFGTAAALTKNYWHKPELATAESRLPSGTETNVDSLKSDGQSS